MEDDRDRPEGGPGTEPDADPEGDAADRWADDPEASDVSDGPHTALPPKVESWRRRSAAGAILTGFALGLQEALEKRKEEPSIVMETSGEPPKELPVEADFEYGRPRQSVVQIRPWLLPDAPAEDPPSSPEHGEEQAGQAGQAGPAGREEQQ